MFVGVSHLLHSYTHFISEHVSYVYVKGYLSDSGVNSLSDCDYVWLGDENIEEQVIEKGVGERVKGVTERSVGLMGEQKRIMEDVMGIEMGFDGRLKG